MSFSDVTLGSRMDVGCRFKFRSLESRYAYKTSCPVNAEIYPLLEHGFQVYHVDEEDNVLAICSLLDTDMENPIYRTDGCVFINKIEMVNFIPMSEK